MCAEQKKGSPEWEYIQAHGQWWMTWLAISEPWKTKDKEVGDGGPLRGWPSGPGLRVGRTGKSMLCSAESIHCRRGTNQLHRWPTQPVDVSWSSSSVTPALERWTQMWNDHSARDGQLTCSPSCGLALAKPDPATTVCECPACRLPESPRRHYILIDPTTYLVASLHHPGKVHNLSYRNKPYSKQDCPSFPENYSQPQTWGLWRAWPTWHSP